MNNNLVEKLQFTNSNLIDNLLKSEDFLNVNESVKVTNMLRWSMAQILNDGLKNIADDPKLLAQYRGLIKELDQAVFTLARLSQEDKHLDNEELVAKALNEVTRSIRGNPYQERNDFYTEQGLPVENIELPNLPDGEFTFTEGSGEVGLINTNFKTFEEEILPGLKNDTNTKEDTPKPETTTIERDAPLPPPLPGLVV